jgi:XRE family transcriptional regulator, fatty acid utilization regulator
MPDAKDIGVGARIAVLRRALGMSQRELAERSLVSYSNLTKIESGHRPPTPQVTAACARGLGVHARALTGESYIDGMNTDALLALAGPIRAALDLYDLPCDETVNPRPLRVLRSSVGKANRVAQAAKYSTLAQGLPALLIELHTAAHTFTGSDQVEAWGLLSEAYRLGHTYGIAMRMPDLSAEALSRMDWAAQRAGDRGPGLRAAREYLRVTAYLRNKDYDACRRLNASGVSLLDGTDDRTPGALVARGQLHLGASIIAARSGQPDEVKEHLAQAGRIADKVGEGHWSTFWFGFGATNVQVHRSMAAVEGGDYAAAVDAAKGLQFPEGWLPSRIGHHHIDLARAYHWMNKPENAMDELLQAQAVAPQQARHHPLVRETVVQMVRTSPRVPDTLATYAAWIGV